MKNKFSINLEVTLVEIIISILIFAICSVISLNCFFIARYTQIKSNDKILAGNLIQSNIEIIKSFNNYNETNEFLLNNFQLLKSENNVHKYVVFYDKNWRLTSEADKEYSITVSITDKVTNNGTLIDIDLFAEKFEPYPFINKSNSDQYIYTIKTNKFFPSY